MPEEIVGTVGKAIANPRRHGPKAWEATISAWLVNASWAPPFWSWWQVCVIHLRDIPGVRPAHKAYPEAEYALMIMALDPEKGTPDPEGQLHFLHPADVVEQFHGLDDAGAKRLCEMAASAIINGHISPDQDYRSSWKVMIRNAVEHIALGGHPTGGIQ